MASFAESRDLLAALKDGNSAATRHAWETFFATLCGVAVRRLAVGRRRMLDGEDIALSAFASVCRSLKHGQYPQLIKLDELGQLLVTVTERKAWKLLRDEKRQKRGGGRVSGESVFFGLGSSGRGIESIASAEPTPEFVAIMEETIGNMLGALDEQSQQVALLKLEGHTNVQVADRLDRSEATIERKLKLIRSTWLAMLDAGNPDDA